MARFSVSQIMSEKSVEELNNSRRVVDVPLDLIDSSPKNHYSMSEIEELATSIETVGLLQYPLMRQKPNGRYELIAGHRRIAAIRMLAQDDAAAWGNVPGVVIRTADDIQAELMLIMANQFRPLTDADRVWQAERVKDLLIALKSSGFKFGRRMREEMAARMGTSSTNIARYEKISSDLVPELREEFNAGHIGISEAYDLARKPAEVQNALSKQRQAEKEPRPVMKPKTALVAGGMEHGITSAEKVEISEAAREGSGEAVAEFMTKRMNLPRGTGEDELITIYVTAAVFGRLDIGAVVTFEEPGGKRFEALLAREEAAHETIS